MKAVLCKTWGPPDALVVEDIPSPKPGKGQLLVSVKASGVNFPDVLLIQNKYQFKPDLPFSPGSEIAGVVRQVGEGVHGFMPGDRVMAHIRWGGYAEEAGETLLVLGAAGGVGLAAVELGKLFGARVIACASSDEKLETCKRFGAEVTINYEREDLREALKNLGAAVDVALDPVGGKYSEPAVRAMAWNGRYLVVGFASGEIPKIALNLTLLKGCSIVGVFWGEFAKREFALNAANLRELTAWLRAKKIKPLVSASYPLDRAADALKDMMNRKVQGKVVLTTD
ncbi:MAG: NADPH:quinone oxidoreductase family protein [Betaproteobacteria bacterium]|nr:MAG: NADPH:quinone oxidoreductase family protein [Betaproteobacteria bacterium]